jgi:hypothetical protein
MAITLSLTEEFEFDKLIEKSVIARYKGELERADDGKGGAVFVPLDETHLHDLLIEL